MIPVKALILGDTQIPFEHSRALNLALKIGEQLQPDLIILNGDILDCFEISQFDKRIDMTRQFPLHYELERGKSFLKELRHRFPKARIVFIFGNHEHRWARYIERNAKELFGLKGMTLEEQLECKESKVQVIYSGNKESSWLWGKLLIGHFDLVRKHGGYTAKALLDSKSISIIQNHTHRGGSSFQRLYDRDIAGYENFCLCDRNPHYADRPNWTLGFSVVYKDPESDYYFVSQHPIAEIRRRNQVFLKTFFNGKVYEG